MALRRKASEGGDTLVVPHNNDARVDFARFLAGEQVKGSDLQALGAGEEAEAFRDYFRRHYARGIAGTDFEGQARRAPWNPPTRFSHKSQLADNDHLVLGGKLESIKGRLLNKLRTLAERTGSSPITVLRYFDDSDAKGCFTDHMLEETLKRILGGAKNYEELVHVLTANLRTGQTGRPMVNHRSAYLQQLREATEDESIVISAGTFNDADDVHGIWFQENVFPLLLKNPKLRGLFLCWSHQVLVRALAKRHKFPAYVLRGAAQWGTFTTQFDPKSPLVRAFPRVADCNQPVSMGSTHSDHVILPGRVRGLGDTVWGADPEDEGRRMEAMRVVAWDPHLRLPSGVMTPDRHFLGLADHPEILRFPHLEQIRDYIERVLKPAGFFEGRYEGVTSEDIAGNFSPILEGRSVIQHDVGESLYAGVLLEFAESLLADLERR